MKKAHGDFRPLGRPIDSEFSGWRLDAYLALHYPFRSRQGWQNWMKGEGVFLNQQSVLKPSKKLRRGDQIGILSDRLKEEEEENYDSKILWEGQGVAAVYKPSGLSMHEAGRYFHQTLRHKIHELLGPQWEAVHRLDRETSGVVLCGSNLAIRSRLCEAFRLKRFQKRYLAIGILNSSLSQESWIVDQPLGAVQGTMQRSRQGVVPWGKPSQTRFTILEKTYQACFFQAEPFTGRTHQIRVHAAWSGFPLVGDKKYCPDESIFVKYLEDGFTPEVAEACFFPRLCLHGASISFVHPQTGVFQEVDCPLPQDMVDIWNFFIHRQKA